MPKSFDEEEIMNQFELANELTLHHNVPAREFKKITLRNKGIPANSFDHMQSKGYFAAEKKRQQWNEIQVRIYRQMQANKKGRQALAEGMGVSDFAAKKEESTPNIVFIGTMGIKKLTYFPKSALKKFRK